MEHSPNGLSTPRPKRRGLSKRPMYILIAAILVMVGALYYAMDYGERRKAQRAKEEKTVHVDERKIAQMDGAGLALQPPEKSPAVMTREIPKVAVAKPKNIDMEAEQLRKRREQMYLAALSSPLVAKKAANNSVSAIEPKKEAASSDTPVSGVQSSNYDPAADMDKERFFDRTDTSQQEWLSQSTREPGRPYEIKTGTVIPAILISGINSDLPGQMIAQISQNVYDTATGADLLFPQGAKLYGTYDSRVILGQERVLIAWNRVIFPDGTSITLGAMPGADMGGYAGFSDQVNNHYLRTYANAFLMSLVVGHSSYIVDNLEDNEYDANGNEKSTLSNEMAKSLAQQMSQVTLRILEKNLNNKPTLEIRPGYQFNVIATKDLAFNEPYENHYPEKVRHVSAIRP